MKPKNPTEAPFIHNYQIRVYYEDTDFTGLVYHANYLRFFERAREEMLGVEKIRELYEKGCHLVVRSLEIDYLKPANHADLILIKTTAQRSGYTTVLCWHEAYRETTTGEQELLTRAQLKLVTINKSGRPTRLPLAVRPDEQIK